MTFPWILPLRAVQGLLAFIVLGTAAYVANWWNNNLWEASSPSQFNFLIFAACWTLLYLVVAFLPFPVLKHKFIVLGAEFVTMLFWFAGFIAAAAWLTDHPCFGSVCSAAKAADVFAAFSWLVFVATVVVAALHVFNTRNSGTTQAAPEMQTQPGV